MDKKWFILYASFITVIRMTVLWALCVAFMNYGICWRTVIAFMILIAGPEIINAGLDVRKKFRREAKTESMAQTDI